MGDAGFKNDPPVIHVRDHPAVLVVIDGDPIFQDLDGQPLEFVVNSAFFLVREPGQEPIFLRGSGMWFTAQELAGPWSVAGNLPAAVTDITPKLEAEEAKQAEAAAADAEALDVEPSPDTAAPEIIVTTVPAELIVTDGAPDFASVAGTQLLYLNNTETDVIMDIAGQRYFVLIAGRWYRSASFENGPWTFVDPDDLPADFAAIPAESDLAAVLPSVGGTQEAREAVLDSQIPQTAEIDRKTATCTVTYDGDPEFESCAEGVAYARNTDKSVLLIDGTYYCCDEAVWFVSARPDGPWTVATEVPAAIQEIPPECPVYNVKYVYIYDSTPEVVYVGYTAGYYGTYVYRLRGLRHRLVLPALVRPLLLPAAGDLWIRRALQPVDGLGFLVRRELRLGLRRRGLGAAALRLLGPGGLSRRLPARLLARLQPRLPTATGTATGRGGRLPARLSATPGRAPRQCYRNRSDGVRNTGDARPERGKPPTTPTATTTSTPTATATCTATRTAPGRSAKAATGRPTPIARPRPTAAPPTRPTAPGTRPPTASRRSSGNGTSSGSGTSSASASSRSSGTSSASNSSTATAPNAAGAPNGSSRRPAAAGAGSGAAAAGGVDLRVCAGCALPLP